MYRIAHISDLHLSLKGNIGRGERLIELLEDITARGCDHVAVTGDIADDPLPEDLIYAREIFAQYGLISPESLSVVPGNHDVYGSAPPGQLSFMFPKICSEVNAEVMESRFAEIFADTFSYNAAYPFTKIFGNVVIIGVNSIIDWSIEGNPEGSSGGMNIEKMAQLEMILKNKELDSKHKIVLIHHHFSKPSDVSEQPAHSLWIKAIGYKMDFHKPGRFLKLLKKCNVKLVLHGHTHYSCVYVKKGITFVNSSSCSIPLADDQVRKYHIISIPGDDEQSSAIGVESVTL